jgi:L-alanine-DL-glutamate epimerase-like enolase superfamily enzyme
VYNTCGGRTYSRGNVVGTGQADEHDDLWLARNAPGELAEQLLGDGFAGMKVWPFDAAARLDDGRRIDPAALREGLAVLAGVREAVGGEIELMLEGHGQWHVSAARTLLRAAAEYDPYWAEDFVLAHDPNALRALAESTTIPLAVSEYLMGRWQYRQVLSDGSVGYLHIDPSWCGGISESQRILATASAFDVVCSMHDCTGPINLLAGMHLAAANSIVGYQEVVRSFLAEVYPTMVDTEWVRTDGRILLSDRPGLGAELTDEYLLQPDLQRRITGQAR